MIHLLAIKQTLPEFLSTPLGTMMWDSQDVKLVLDRKVVFHLQSNDEVKLDTLKLIDEDEFSPVAKSLQVIGYTTIEDVEFIFVKKGC